MAGSGWNPNPKRGPDSPSASPSDAAAESRRPHILVVEDNRADVFLIRESIELAGIDAVIHVARDGDEAVQFFVNADQDSQVPCPALMILDINLPKKPGQSVLKQMQGTMRCGQTPVIVVTSSDSHRDREEMRELGVKEYFRKPSDYDAFMKLGEVVKQWLPKNPRSQ